MSQSYGDFSSCLLYAIRYPYLTNPRADFVYMAPPFMAYYAVATNNATLLKESVRQAKLYREVLVKPDGLWTHIIGPQSADSGSWSTGNGWAAAGMARVLATVMKAPISKGWTSEIAELKQEIKEILDAVMTVGLVYYYEHIS